jgi:hypothetical protein
MRASILASLAGHAALSAALPSDHSFSPRQAGATAYASNSDGSLKLRFQLQFKVLGALVLNQHGT